MPNKHLKYGGSTIARTMACPGWASLAEQVPRDVGPASEAAQRGTALHEAMEYIVENDVSAYETHGMEVNGIEIDADMIDECLIPADNAIDSLVRTYDIDTDEIKIEPFVEIIPDQAGGSIDLLMRSKDGRTVVVVDYKFGHMPVSAVENKQLMFYALCADADPNTAHFFDRAEQIVLAIVQPAHPDAVVQHFTTDMDALDKFEDAVARAIKEAEGGNPSFKAGDHCQYCPGQAICPVKTGLAKQAAKLPTPVVEELDKYGPILDDLEKWIAEVRKLAQHHMENGGRVKGLKLVNKRPQRVWTSKQEVIENLLKKHRIPKRDRYQEKFNSPAQMEAMLKKKGIDRDLIADYIGSVSSGLTVVPESDNREAAMPEKALKAALDRL